MGRRVMFLGVILLLSACTTKPASTSTSTPSTAATTTIATTTTTTATVSTLPGMPEADAFEAAKDAAQFVDGDSFLIEPGACTETYWSTYLDLGSAYALTAPAADGACEVWLGGETENPNYTGLPATYCRFDADAAIVLLIPGRGGPIALDDPECAPTGFPQGSPVGASSPGRP